MPAQAPGAGSAAALSELNELRERRNWLIHQLFIRQEYARCLSVIESQLRETEGMCEYALYVKGLLKRMQGNLSESLTLIDAAVLVSPENVSNRKQLGRALQLVGRHADAISSFHAAEQIRSLKQLGEDWELSYCIGVSLAYLRRYNEAVESFMQSIGIQRNDVAFIHLGRALICAREWQTAIGVYEEALGYSPENPELLLLLGQLNLKLGDRAKAFDFLGRALTQDPSNAKALLSACSVIQDNGDYDVALTKYRVAVARMPDSPQLWNNIGACFFGKRNEYAAAACLRKALFLSPLEWIPNYNLGLVFLSMGRHASAFHCLSAAVTLHGRYAPAYMFLGVCLSLMNDADNACAAYEKALSLDNDMLVRLNYAVTLYNSGLAQQASEQFHIFAAAWEALTPEQQRSQPSSIPGTLRQLQKCLESAVIASQQQQLPAKIASAAAPPPPPPLPTSSTSAFDENGEAGPSTEKNDDSPRHHSHRRHSQQSKNDAHDSPQSPQLVPSETVVAEKQDPLSAANEDGANILQAEESMSSSCEG